MWADNEPPLHNPIGKVRVSQRERTYASGGHRYFGRRLWFIDVLAEDRPGACV